MNDSAPPSNETEIRFSVLLVDDEPLILSSLRRLLRNQPYDLLLAESGEQALQLLESRPVDLVVSDARMPNMDGAALLAEIHRRSRKPFASCSPAMPTCQPSPRPSMKGASTIT